MLVFMLRGQGFWSYRTQWGKHRWTRNEQNLRCRWRPVWRQGEQRRGDLQRLWPGLRGWWRHGGFRRGQERSKVGEEQEGGSGISMRQPLEAWAGGFGRVSPGASSQTWLENHLAVVELKADWKPQWLTAASWGTNWYCETGLARASWLAC